jgi:hypothetical protein
MNHEIHKAHEMRSGADILYGDRLHRPGEAAVPGHALSFRVFGVFRGFKCFFQVHPLGTILQDNP